MAREAAPPVAGDAAPLAHRERHRFERIEMRKERIDLEGAHEAALDALLRLERRDVGAREQDLATVRPQHAGHEVDQRGLSGAVRADERVARAFGE